jgi:hypothetical protein
MAAYRIIISQRGKFVVRPGRLHIRKNDTIVWKAIGTDAHVLIPDQSLFVGGVQAINLTAGQDSSPFEVSPNACIDKVYAYAAFCDSTGEFAQGDSDPELIVGP